MWGGGIQVVRDEYTKAPENQLIVTANLYADYDVVQRGRIHRESRPSSKQRWRSAWCK